jgi:S1-C subfamily serine protease
MSTPPDAIIETPVGDTVNENSTGGFPHVLVYSIGGGVLGLFILAAVIGSLTRGGGNAADVGGGAGASTTALGAQEIYEKYSPSVVQIIVFDIDGDALGSGSGFLVSPDGGLVTNKHVVDVRGAEHFEVIHEGARRGQTADFIVQHSSLDLAYLKIRRPTQDYLSLTPQLPKVGEKVFAIGNPLSLRNTISTGIVSGLREREDGHTEIQFTAPISPGSSGGPLFNDSGQVIGVTSAFIEGGQNLNLAMPIEAVVRLIEDGH